MPTPFDLAPLLSAVRYATAAYAVIATILTTACLALHLVTRIDRLALGRGPARSSRQPGAGRPLFVPLDHPKAAST
jgi:hypothetical protein